MPNARDPTCTASPLLTLSLSSCREKVQPQEPPKLDELAPDEREMKLVELTHRKWGRECEGGFG